MTPRHRIRANVNLVALSRSTCCHFISALPLTPWKFAFLTRTRDRTALYFADTGIDEYESPFNTDLDGGYGLAEIFKSARLSHVIQVSFAEGVTGHRDREKVLLNFTRAKCRLHTRCMYLI